MTKLQELIEKRAKAWEGAKAFVESKKDKDGLLSDEDVKTYHEMESKIQQFTDENLILNNLHKWYGHDCQISQLSKGSENLNYLIGSQLVIRVLYLAKSSPIFSQAFPYLEREVYFVNTLYENKLNALRYLSFPDGKFIHRLDVKDGSLFFLKSPYLIGERMTFSSSNLSELARNLANIHDFSQRYLMTFERVPFYDDLISSLHFRAFSYNP